MAKYSVGVSKIEMGAIAGDGDMGATLVDVGDIYQGETELTSEDPQLTEHYSDTKEDPILVTVKKGKTTLKFTIIDVLPTNLVKFLGGAASGTTPAFTWEQPDAFPIIEQSLKITTPEGYTIAIPRARIASAIKWNFGKQQLAKVTIMATVLAPTKTGVKALKLTLA